MSDSESLVDLFSDVRIAGIELVPGPDMDDADTYRFAVDLFREGKYDQVVTLVEPLVGRRREASVRELLARAYFARAQLGRAEEVFRDLVEENPADRWLRAALARTLRRQSRHDEADTQERVVAALA